MARRRTLRLRTRVTLFFAFIALLAGEHAYGVWGALLAVPTMSIVQSCFRFYLHEVEGLPRRALRRLEFAGLLQGHRLSPEGICLLEEDLPLLRGQTGIPRRQQEQQEGRGEATHESDSLAAARARMHPVGEQQARHQVVPHHPAGGREPEQPVTGAQVEVQGHTDSRGGDAYNQRLSEKRANSVREHLINRHGIDSERLQSIGYGETKPIASNRTARGREGAVRAEIRQTLRGGRRRLRRVLGAVAAASRDRTRRWVRTRKGTPL